MNRAVFTCIGSRDNSIAKAIKHTA